MAHHRPREGDRGPHSDDDFADITGGDRREETTEPSRKDASSLHEKFDRLARRLKWQKEVFRRQAKGIFSFIRQNRKEIAGTLAAIGVIIGIGVLLVKRQEQKEAETLARCTALASISLSTRLALRDGKLDPESLSGIIIHDPETHRHEARLGFSEEQSYSQGVRRGGLTIDVDNPDCPGGDVRYETDITIGPNPKEYTSEAQKE